ncbi:MAG TPA: hypothetical protein PLD47_02255 [Aggregatilineales bacterium]|nr:class I SAM-dependent DNA methyltransferase [Anaerolineales bacterium]HRE46521.1 hypothetical protein [Aggregatilineales bacterium]
MTLTWRDFVQRWTASALGEQQAAQSHFNELCRLVGHKTPTELDPLGEFFTFEEQVTKATGGRGRADVWYKGKFAWEYKGKHKDLDAAYAQLLAYKGSLGNPPLLIVSDMVEYRIYPQWVNTSGQPFIFRNADLLFPDAQRYIVWLLEDPDRFKELREDELRVREQLTTKLAQEFAHLSDLVRKHQDPNDLWSDYHIARFFARLTFCLFAEDVQLMPRPFDQPVFRYLTDGARNLPEDFVAEMTRLFMAMDGRQSGFVMRHVPYFNGGLFNVDDDPAHLVFDLAKDSAMIDLLEKISKRDWRKVNPTIFGTLFEAALDPAKRAQLGAHYTSEADIRLVVDPVLMQPLYDEWALTLEEAEPLFQTLFDGASPRQEETIRARLTLLHDRMMFRLETTQILDPACGSGNFLYVSLRALKDLEARVRKTFEPLGLPFRDVVTPRQLYGIEKDPYAANLAFVVIWIGYLQWRYEDQGVLSFRTRVSRPNPRHLPHPIIQDKYPDETIDHILCEDALLRYDAEGKPYEPEWVAVDVIMGNPPFLGGSRQRRELGGAYLDDLQRLYQGRLARDSDLVCYWFEKARAHLDQGKAKRVGFIATNSIRGGSNRLVLDRIKATGDIFMAWSDNPWLLAGAAVRISIVGFDNKVQTARMLDGAVVENIHADLTAGADLTGAKVLAENARICFRSDEKGGSFDIDEATARAMLAAKNRSGKSNADVVRPYINGLDVTRGRRNRWVIDFGVDTTEAEAAHYKMPYEYVKRMVKPERDMVNNERHRTYWWIHRIPAGDMREAIRPLKRFIATPSVAKHRLFVWVEGGIIPDHQLYVFARDDDYFFGVLHSYIHELWSLQKGTSLEDRPRYTPTTTFETFPLPYPPGKEDTASPLYQAISTAAKALHEGREAWLHPVELAELGATAKGKALSERTLTNLYNALAVHRAEPSMGKGKGGNGKNGDKPVKAAAQFAPQLAALHEALDRAVLSAYGWTDLALTARTPAGQEAILRRLLALNQARISKA